MPTSAPASDTRFLAATLAATAACVCPAFLVGAMAVQVRADLGFSESGTGLCIGAFFGAASLGSAALGRQVERIGGSRALRTASLLAAGFQLAVAGLARSLTSLLVLLALAGATNALGQPAANLLIARALPVNRQGLGFAVKQSAIPLSTLLGGLAVPSLALTVGWRWAFVALAGLSALAAASVPKVDTTRRTWTEDDGAGRAPLAVMLVLGFGCGGGAAAAGTLGAFLTSAAVEVGFAPGAAGLCLTVGSLIGLTARIIAGLRADLRQGGHLRVVALMLALGAVAYLILAGGRVGFYLVGIPLAFGAGWAWPGLFNLAVVLANPAAPGAATGITQTGTYFGAVAGPLLFGLLAEHTSYRAAWIGAAVTSTVAALSVLTARAMLRRARLPDPPLPPFPAA